MGPNTVLVWEEWKITGLTKRSIIAFAFVIALTLLFAIFQPAEGGTDQYIQGMTDIRNGTVTINAGGATFTSNTGTLNDVNFTGWVNGSTFYWVHDNIPKLNDTIANDTTIFQLFPDVPCEIWEAIWDNSSRVLIFRTHTGIPTPLTYLSIGGFTGFWSMAWGGLAYFIVLLVPISAWLKTKSIAMFAIVLLFMSAGGLVMLPAMIPFASLGIMVAVGVLLYLVLYKRGGG